MFQLMTKTEMDDLILDELRFFSSRAQTPSPTPSEILRQEGFLAPEAMETNEQDKNGTPSSATITPAPQKKKRGRKPKVVKDKEKSPDTAKQDDSGISSNSEPEPSELPVDCTGIPEEQPVTNKEVQKHVEQEQSDSGCEKDFVENEKTGEPTPPLPTTSPVRSLTVLAPAALNSSIVTDSSGNNANSESPNNDEPSESPPTLKPPVKEGLIIKSPAALGATSPPNLLSIPLDAPIMNSNEGFPMETSEVKETLLPYGAQVSESSVFPQPVSSPSLQHPSSPGFSLPRGITLTSSRAPSPATSQTSASPTDLSPVSTPSLPAGLGRSISISPSPSTKSVEKRSLPAAVVEPVKRSRPESPDCLVVEDGPQEMPNLPSGISLTVRGNKRSNVTNGVTDILASRGISVTPAANKTPPPVQSSRASVSALPVTTLNLSSAVSIVPASQAKSRFAVPQSRKHATPTVKLPTVDLTDDTPTIPRRRTQRFSCQICDKVFISQETLNTHLATHRNPSKLPYKCNICSAQYPSQLALQQHKQNYHKESIEAEMALPVVEMTNRMTMQKMQSLGITHFIVLAQLTNSSGGMFGIPIVAYDNARNPAVCNLRALGSQSVLPLGSAKLIR